MFRDAAIGQLSEMLFALPEDPPLGHELLDASRLDYSLESLAHLDNYIRAVGQREQTVRESAVIVMRAGAHLGEVIRRHSARLLHWLEYEGALEANPDIARMGPKAFSLVAILWDGDRGFWFPLLMVAQLLTRTAAEPTESFARALLATDLGYVE